MDTNKKINALFGAMTLIVIMLLLSLAVRLALFAPVSKIGL